MKPLEVKSKWNERIGRGALKVKQLLRHMYSISLDDCTFPRHKKIRLAMIYVSMDQQVKIVVPNLQQ